MTVLLTLTAVGALLFVIGIVNMTGNISSVHEYHRHRVSEEDRKPFGRLVGLGTVLIGLATAFYGVLLFISQRTQNDVLVVIGVVELIGGIIAGLTLSFYAMKRYNKGIF